MSADSAVAPGTLDIAELLRSRAATYYPGAVEGRCQVTLLWRRRRSYSEVGEYRLSCGQWRRSVIVKVASSPQSREAYRRAAADDRPRVTPRTDPSLKGAHEYAALCRIHDHFSQLDDAAFGAVRPLEMLPEQDVLIMEKGPDRSLSHHLRRANRLQRPMLRFPLRQAVERSGRWLREFHRMTPPDHCQPRCETRDGFRENCRQLLDYLLRHAGQSERLPGIQRRLERLIPDVLPARFELGVTHGDFAPRNLLVEPDGRVTGFDTHAHWQAPVEEDLAHFLVALKLSGRQVLSCGLFFSPALLGSLEADFLRGFYDGPPPLARVRLFQCQRLLDWWSSLVFVHRTARGRRRLAKRCRLALWQPHLARCLRRTLDEADSARPAEAGGGGRGLAGK